MGGMEGRMSSTVTQSLPNRHTHTHTHTHTQPPPNRLAAWTRVAGAGTGTPPSKHSARGGDCRAEYVRCRANDGEALSSPGRRRPCRAAGPQTGTTSLCAQEASVRAFVYVGTGASEEVTKKGVWAGQRKDGPRKWATSPQDLLWLAVIRAAKGRR